MIKTLTSIIFGIKRHCLFVVNIKLISYKYSLLSNRISSQIRLPTMQQHGRNRQQAGDNRQHHGGNQQQHGGNRGNQKEEFVFFFGPKCTFSQMHRAKFTIDGEEFCCMEQYMQYQKAVTFGDGKTANLIMSTEDPKQHKKLGRKVSPFDPKVWGNKSEVVVRKGNNQKYLQNPSMKRELFATHPKTLVEASPRDRLWGIGLGKDNPKARDRSQWRGKNLLGQILTEVRDHLMTQEGFISSKSSSVEVGHVAKKEDSSCQHRKEEFVFFFGPKFTFSQMHRAKFTVDGEEFCCMEQYMQYQKAVTFGDGKTAKLIMSTQDPFEHKELGRKVAPFDPKTWGWKSVAVVKRGNIQKYLQNPSMKRELFATHPKTLVEASPRDRLWGIGLGKDNPKARDRSQWRGKNLLGQVLTEVRDHLMAREGLIRHKAKLDDTNSSLKINTNAEYKKIDHEKHNLNKKDKHVSEIYDVHKYRNPNRDDISKSDRHDKEIPSRSKGRGETTPKKERSGDGKSSSSKKGRHEGDSGSDGSHLGDGKSTPSKKRKREGDSHSEKSHQSDEDRPSPKKSRREGHSHSVQSYSSDEDLTSSMKRKREGGSHSEQSHQSYIDKPSSTKGKREGDSHSECSQPDEDKPSSTVSTKRKREGHSHSEQSHQSYIDKPSLTKRKREGDSHSECSQPDEDKPSSMKRKREGDSHSECSQCDEDRPSSKKSRREGDSHSEQSHQSDEDKPSSMKRKREGDSHTGESHGKGSSENNENVTYNKDEKADSILKPSDVMEGEQDKEKDRDVETEKTCNQKADKKEARATTEFIITNAPKNEDDTHPDSGKNKQKKITVRLPETKVCDKDERSNKDAAKTCKSDALELIAGYGTEDANELEKVQNPNLPAEEKKCDDPDTLQESKDTKP